MNVDTADLLNATEVAQVLGLAHRTAIATYRRRYPDFPEPVISKGTCVLWLRPDVERWKRSRVLSQSSVHRRTVTNDD